MSKCLSCEVATGNLQTVGGILLKTEHFNVSQDAEYLIPGFLILASNRHFKHLDEMTDEEASEFGIILRRSRRALREALQAEDVYYFYNEDTRHHFHLWMLPREDWMKEFGKSVQSIQPALDEAKLSLKGPAHLERLQLITKLIKENLSRAHSR